MLDRPAPPSGFLAALRQRFGASGPTLTSIFQVGDAIAEAGADPSQLPAGTEFQRIAVLGGAVTIDFLRRTVACAVLQEDVFPIVHQAPYGSYVQQVLDPASDFHAFAPELVVIATHWRDMVTPLPIGGAAAEIDATLRSKVDLFRTLWQQLAGKGIRIIQHLVAPPSQHYRGVAERLARASPVNQVHRLNEMLLDAGRGLVTWVDMEALANEIGTSRFSPARFYHAAKLDHDQRWLPDYLPPFRAAWRSANGRAKKVLVLDLDNTLWGGVIGDDGVDGISLGSATPAGEAFADWQRYLKSMSERGVILAICSKNDPEIAESAFTHASSALRRSDFAAFECSWSDKVSGLRRISRDLNVGLDSFVFCDDNPAECDLVRQELPEVAVVCLGTEPASFIHLFDAGHWLDVNAYTREDLGRAAAYTARSAALTGQATATDIGRYLAGLEMRATLRRPEAADFGRIGQLELKTNQFNLTTRRYSETQLRSFMTREDAVLLAFRLRDRFGDHGLTSTLIAFHEGDTLRIDSWLMSCRIFSRSAEQYILRGLLDIAEKAGAIRVIGEYLPTAKNAVVADLYARLRFTPTGGGFFVRELAAGVDDLVSYISAD